ncbi:capsular exopolysaccharide synthesis family protein [Sphingomonas jinjuensis]|uniref:Capsular exopolysaccharide synthesis family protein n=1 Tax=Sphingomonas jinjuensis TaxID=535907 RepID=A0A840FFI1_9SPHN|nr:polysaccharide biosynthesis tyrosine autokinase [Sphingomonas jinjuensis]MBB4154474.1 capsular exopolysaccharide synthesis family protein [Sphingomonas jinjuensis]
MNTINPVRRLATASPTMAPGDFPAENADQTPFVRYVMRLAFRWRKVIGTIIAACLLLGLVITLLMTPQYTATTTIEIARESDRIVNIQGVQSDASDADQEFYQTQYGLLKSKALAERVATQLRLVDDPSFFQMFDIKSDSPIFATDARGALPPGSREKRTQIAGSLLLANLKIEPVRASQLVELSFTSPDPNLSARVANAWSVNFIQQTLQRRYEATSYARNFLESRLGQLRQRVEESERKLVGYARAQRLVTIPNSGTNGTQGERSLAADDLTLLNNNLAEATAARIQAETRLRQNGGDPSQSAEALGNSAIGTLRARRADLAGEYQKLMPQFTPDYPAAKALQAQIAQIDRSIAREESRIGGSIDLNYRQAKAREDALQSQVNKLKDELLDFRRRNIQYAIYQRDADTNRQLYDALLQRYKEIGVAGGVGVNNVAVVDDADVPERPSSPRLVLNMLLALISGCALGALAAFLLEQSDEAIADPTEVERMVGLPLLGSVPKLSDRTPVEALGDRKSDMVDAYLAVQTNLSFSTERGVPASLAITSTRPAEGKSTTSLALAVSLARAQRRVILVDGDMRSPSVHHLIGTDHNRGLSNFLAGDDAIEPLLHRVDMFGIAAMTAGPIPPNAAELLTSDRLKVLVEKLLESFDHVVIDSPPVMGLADAPLIASRVEGVVYAVESHGIRSSLVRTALGRLASANARVLGVVLTKFEARRSAGYGYDYGYNYGRDGVPKNR